MNVVWGKLALRDLDEIAVYITNDSPQNAFLVEDRIYRAALALSQFPSSGRLGRVPGTRERVVAKTSFILIYRIEPNAIRILRVVRGARKWPR